METIIIIVQLLSILTFSYFSVRQLVNGREESIEEIRIAPTSFNVVKKVSEIEKRKDHEEAINKDCE